MKLMFLVDALREGKKIRRLNWKEGSYIICNRHTGSFIYVNSHIGMFPIQSMFMTHTGLVFVASNGHQMSFIDDNKTEIIG